MSEPKFPDTNRLLEVLVRLHDDVRQIQYPYSAKVRKWGAITEGELLLAESDPSASEATIWAGLKPSEAAARIAGGATNFLDQEGFRERWSQLGMAETSWQAFIKQYVNLKPDSIPFSSPDYFRFAESENLLSLAKILDAEVFAHLKSDDGSLRECMKTKWWETCHAVFAQAVSEAVYRNLRLPARPVHVCYTPQWTESVHKEVSAMAARWRNATVWQMPQGIDPSVSVDFATNNASRVKELLTHNGFTTLYLEGRD